MGMMEILNVFKHALSITFFVFVMLYARGIVPFSVLLTASFVQDGHGMLPLLSYSVRDSVLVKTFNLVYGLFIGYGLLFIGL